MYECMNGSMKYIQSSIKFQKAWNIDPISVLLHRIQPHKYTYIYFQFIYNISCLLFIQLLINNDVYLFINKSEVLFSD